MAIFFDIPTALKRHDFDAVKVAALATAPVLLRQLLPGGKLIGTEYVVRNPLRSDRAEGSFKINVRTGRWADFATGDKGGDLIALVAFLNGSSQSDAARRLAHMLGINIGGRRHGY